jgi:hypothetical protein
MTTASLQTGADLATSPIRIWLRRLPGSRFWPWRYILIGSVQAADEVPVILPARTAVVVLAGERQTWLAFDCPKHHHERILLNLSAARRPRWSLETRNPLTIFPSIDADHKEGRCHFWIKRGKVKWGEY